MRICLSIYGRLFFKRLIMREIKNVFVNWISLVSKKETPAVEQAESKFALFKTINKSNSNINKDLLDIKINLNKYELQKIKDNL